MGSGAPFIPMHCQDLNREPVMSEKPVPMGEKVINKWDLFSSIIERVRDVCSP